VKTPDPLPRHLQAVPFTTGQARASNLTPSRLRSSDLQHPFRGVHVATAIELGFVERCRALQLRLPPAARFSDTTAARIIGIPLPPGTDSRRLHVTVPSPDRAPVRQLVIGHSRHGEPIDTREWNGLRVSSPERAWCELGATLKLPDLVAAGDYLIHHRLPITTRGRLTDAAARYARGRGSRELIEAIALLDDRAESPQESRLRVILTRAGIATVSNLTIRTRRGETFRADLAIPDHGILIEYQGDYHRDPQQYRADMTRISKLEADDHYVILVNANDLADPTELVARVRQVKSRRASR
jgi:very-short-patch-repair endonuclease